MIFFSFLWWRWSDSLLDNIVASQGEASGESVKIYGAVGNGTSKEWDLYSVKHPVQLVQ